MSGYTVNIDVFSECENAIRHSVSGTLITMHRDTYSPEGVAARYSIKTTSSTLVTCRPQERQIAALL